METIDGEPGIEVHLTLVVEIRFEVDMVGLRFDVAVDMVELVVPERIGFRMERVADVRRMDGHEREEDGPDVVRLARC